MFKKTREDINTVQQKDPAASSKLTIFLTHPGVKALRRHRRANFFYRHKLKFIAYMISYRTRKITGIEIHPEAKIGRRVLIDHGMGIVIGQTTVIGNDCTIYHNVTLGSKIQAKADRHPKIGNNVIIYPNSIIIGNIKIGDNTVIAANSVVLKECPDNSILVGSPAKNIKENS